MPQLEKALAQKGRPNTAKKYRNKLIKKKQTNKQKKLKTRNNNRAPLLSIYSVGLKYNNF